MLLWHKKSANLHTPTIVEAFVEFAVVVAVEGVVAEDVAVATLQFFVEGRYIECFRIDFIGKDGEDGVFAEVEVHGTEFREVFIGFPSCQSSNRSWPP